MKLNEFHVGQTLFGISYRDNQHRDYTSSRYEITSIGRKYLQAVHQGYNHIHRFFIETKERFEHLREDCDCGYPILLFSSETDALRYVEWQENMKFLRGIFNAPYKLNKYSAEQIRAVKDILEPEKKELSIKDFYINQTVFVLSVSNEADQPKWKVSATTVMSTDDTGITTNRYSPKESYRFEHINTNDQFLTEVNPKGTARLLFAEPSDIPEYLIEEVF